VLQFAPFLTKNFKNILFTLKGKPFLQKFKAKKTIVDEKILFYSKFEADCWKFQEENVEHPPQMSFL
jgi:hypothetical protein